MSSTLQHSEDLRVHWKTLKRLCCLWPLELLSLGQRVFVVLKQIFCFLLEQKLLQHVSPL